MGKTCKDCTHFIGCGDWNLCCTESHEGYPLGFLCYEDTPVCKKFDEKLHSLDLNEIQKRIKGTISTEEALKDVEPWVEEEQYEQQRDINWIVKRKGNR